MRVVVLLCLLLIGGCRETYNECVSRKVWRENAKDWDEINRACDKRAALTAALQQGRDGGGA